MSQSKSESDLLPADVQMPSGEYPHSIKTPTFLSQGLWLLKRESIFIFHLLLIFTCSAAAVSVARQILPPLPVEVTRDVRIVTTRPVVTKAAPVVAHVPSKVPVRLALRQTVPVIVPVAKPIFNGYYRARGAASVTVRSPRKAWRSHPPRSPDPMVAVRTILKRDYKISKVTGSYDSYMSWARKTLKAYQTQG